MADESELGKIVRELADELGSMPDDPALSRAFTNRVEKVIAGNRAAPAGKLASLHLLAAEGIAAQKVVRDAAALASLAAHLDAAMACADLPTSMLDLLRSRKAAAFARFQGEKSRDILSNAIAAFEDVLNHPATTDEPANLGVFAYNAANDRLRLDGYDAPEPNRQAIERLFHLALEHYKKANLPDRAADAAFELAQIALARLEAAETPPSDRPAIFADAWRLMQEATAPIGMTRNQLLWARRNEVAAELIWRRPGFSRSANADAAIHHLDVALNVYQQFGDAALAAACAGRLADRTSYLGGVWNEQLVRRFLYYLEIAVAARLGEPLQEGARYMLLANACAQALLGGARGSTAIAERKRTLAEQSCVLGAADNQLCIQALFLVGNSWLEADRPPEEKLARATEAFERALQLAHAPGAEDQEVKALRLLGIALARRFAECGESELYPKAADSLEQAGSRSSGEERGVAYLNLASITVEALRRGLNVPVERAQSAAGKAWDLADKINPAHRDYMQQIAGDIDDFAFGISRAIESAVKLAPTLGRPDVLHFKVYRAEKHGEPAHYVRTLLLFLSDDGKAAGRMSLAFSDPSLIATFALDCPHCGAPQEFILPVITLLDDDPAARQRLQQEGDSQHCCSVCGAAEQVQFAFLARAGDSTTLVVPDAFPAKGRTMLLQQSSLLMTVHEAWTGAPPAEGYSIPWSGLQEFRYIPPAQFEHDRRQQALALLVTGSLLHDEARLRQALADDSPALTIDHVEEADMAPILDSLDLGTAAPELSPAVLANQANMVLTFTRRQGREAALRLFRQLWDESAASEADFQAAADIAADPRQRRAFLQQYLADSPDYSNDREAELYRLLQLGTELEVRGMEAEGVPQSDPDRYRGVLAMLESSREFVRQMIDDDRQKNSSKPAKTLLDEALRVERRFILLLRTFRADVRSGFATENAEKMAGKVADPRVTWQVNSYAGGPKIVETVAARLAEHAGVLMVANASDPLPPATPAKLFVTNLEWRKLAFALIGEAAATVLILRAESLSEGVEDEIRAILTLGRASHTAIVVSEPDVDDSDDIDASFMVDATPRADPAELMARLRQMGFPHVFLQSEFLERPWQLVSGLGDFALANGA